MTEACWIASREAQIVAQQFCANSDGFSLLIDKTSQKANSLILQFHRIFLITRILLRFDFREVSLTTI